MSYCISCGEIAVVCYCNFEKKLTDDYVAAQKECNDLKCYCRKHMPVS